MVTISLPVWLFWVVGGIIGCIILALAVVGVIFLWSFKDGIGWR